jgi:hypothetical protein
MMDWAWFNNIKFEGKGNSIEDSTMSIEAGKEIMSLKIESDKHNSNKILEKHKKMSLEIDEKRRKNIRTKYIKV